ncbi:arsenate reductase family protein [Verrucomicrobiota bacterium sgz303538]
MSLRVYAYEKCDTCRKAVKFLRERGIAHEVMPIRQQPPSVEELRRMLSYLNGDVRPLFNTSGQDYRALNIKDRLPSMSLDETLELLASNGNLIKRPFALTRDSGLVGFKQGEWERFVGAIAE